MRGVIFRNNDDWTLYKSTVYTDIESIFDRYEYFQKTLQIPVSPKERWSKEEIQNWLNSEQTTSMEDTRFIGEDYGDADWFMIAVNIE